MKEYARPHTTIVTTTTISRIVNERLSPVAIFSASDVPNPETIPIRNAVATLNNSIQKYLQKNLIITRITRTIVHIYYIIG